MSDNLKTGRETPPDDDEWASVWEALDKANKSWLITGPFHAAVTNWRGWFAIGGVVLWIKSDEVLALIMNLVRGSI